MNRPVIAALISVVLVVSLAGSYELGAFNGIHAEATSSATTTQSQSSSTSSAGIKVILGGAMYEATSQAGSVNYLANVTIDDLDVQGYQPGLESYAASPFELVTNTSQVYATVSSCAGCGSTLNPGQEISAGLSALVPADQAVTEIEYLGDVYAPAGSPPPITMNANPSPLYQSLISVDGLTFLGNASSCISLNSVNPPSQNVPAIVGSTVILNGSFSVASYIGCPVSASYFASSASNVTLTAIYADAPNGVEAHAITPILPMQYEVLVFSTQGRFSLSVVAPNRAANIGVNVMLTFNYP